MDKELVEAIRQAIKDEISGVKKDVSGIKGQQKENTSILRALEYASKVHKAELDKLNIQVAKLSGNEEKINKLEDGLRNHDHDITIKSNKANVS